MANPDWERLEVLERFMWIEGAANELIEIGNSRGDDTGRYYTWLYEHRQQFSMSDIWNSPNHQIVKSGVDFETNSPRFVIYF